MRDNPATEALDWLADADADGDAEPSSDHPRLDPSKTGSLVMWLKDDEAARPARGAAAVTLDTLSPSKCFGRRTLGGGAPAAKALDWLADADADAEPGSDHLRLEPSKKELQELLVMCKEEDEAARLGSEAKDNGLSELAAEGAGTGAVETRGRK